jgi:hypothetical protein
MRDIIRVLRCSLITFNFYHLSVPTEMRDLVKMSKEPVASKVLGAQLDQVEQTLHAL